MLNVQSPVKLFFTNNSRFLVRQGKSAISVWNVQDYSLNCHLRGELVGISQDGHTLLITHPSQNIYTYNLLTRQVARGQQCQPDSFEYSQRIVVRGTPEAWGQTTFWLQDVLHTDERSSKRSIILTNCFLNSSKPLCLKIAPTPYVLVSVTCDSDWGDYDELWCYDIPNKRFIFKTPIVTSDSLRFSWLSSRQFFTIGQIDNIKVFDLRTGTVVKNTNVGAHIVAMSLHPILDSLIAVATISRSICRIGLVDMTKDN